MSLAAWTPVGLLLSSFLPGLLIFFLREEQAALRVTLNMIGATVKLLLVAVMLLGVWQGENYVVSLPVAPGLALLLRVDALAMLFVTLSATLWFVTTIYAIGYLSGGRDLSRFFGFFSICVSATTGIALAGNLFAFFVFYELLTLSTWPLVVHNGDRAAFAAGRTYLAYTIGGSTALLLGIVWLSALVPLPAFAAAGLAPELVAQHRGTLQAIFLLLIAGLGVKSALVPLHSWLPAAMVAPAPVSALLHAVAVVKAGAFGIVRVVFDVYGIDNVHALGLGRPLTVAAAVTVIYGSIRALAQSDIKRRLAFSTVSQVSYIVLGAAMIGPAATIGGLVHLVHQALMKVTLFFGAGALAKTLHVHRVDEIDGAGWRMPWTMLAFTVAALGMIGVPPVAGFVSKWYLGLGALESGEPWVILVLAGSSLLNAAYFLPLVYRAWFRPARTQWPRRRRGFEAAPGLVLPAAFTALAALGVGLFAGAPPSPLQWAILIAERGYGR